MRLVVVDFSLANAFGLASAFASDPGVTVLAIPAAQSDPWGLIAAALAAGSYAGLDLYTSGQPGQFTLGIQPVDAVALSAQSVVLQQIGQLLGGTPAASIVLHADGVAAQGPALIDDLARLTGVSVWGSSALGRDGVPAAIDSHSIQALAAPDPATPMAQNALIPHAAAPELFGWGGPLGLAGSVWVSDGTVQGTRPVAATWADMGCWAAEQAALPNGRTIFTAWEAATGWEPWVSDGTTAGTHLLKDIQPGAGSSAAWWYQPLHDGSGRVLFHADDGTTGSELWASDGTAAGTVLLCDLDPAAGADAAATGFTEFVPGQVLFRARDGAIGRELWVTDGTAAGTRLVADLAPGAGSASPDFITPVRPGLAVFTATVPGSGNELWATDGTLAGTRLIADVEPGAAGSYAEGFTLAGSGRLIFAATDSSGGTEPWVTDGTAFGTHRLADLMPGAESSSPSGFTALGNGQVMFVATDALHGQELWVSDGTAFGTKLVSDLSPGLTGSAPAGLLPIQGGRVIFAADDGSSGNELWVSDGTAAGTQLLADLTPGVVGSFPVPLRTVGQGHAALYSLVDAAGVSTLWLSDGTAAGTVQVPSGDQMPRLSQPAQLGSIQPGSTSLMETVDLLAGWSDPEGQPLSIQGLQADHGTLLDLGTGQWQYTSDPAWGGWVRFSYAVSDGLTATPTSLDRITVDPINQPPVGTIPSGVVLSVEDSALSLTLQGSDADGVVSGFRLGRLPAHLALFADANLIEPLDRGSIIPAVAGQALIYARPEADWSGVDSLSVFTVDDRGLISADPVVQTLQVTPVNDAPRLTPGAQVTLADATLDQSAVLTQADLLAGWSDPEGAGLQLINLQVDHGRLIDDGSGTLRVMPAFGDAAGRVTLHYEVSDGTVGVPAVQQFQRLPGGVGMAPVAGPGGDFGQATLSLSAATFSPPGTVTVLDFNGDGYQDVLQAVPAGVALTLGAAGAGPVSGGILSHPATGVSGTPVALAATDLWGQGLGNDLLMLDAVPGAPVLGWQPAVSAGVLGAGQSLALTGLSDPVGWVLADLQGDGRRDVVIADRTGARLGLVDTLPTGLASPRLFDLGGLQPTTLVTLDVDRDGRSDLIVADGRQGGLMLLRGDASGTPVTTAHVGSDAVLALCCADLNGDGQPELLSLERPVGANDRWVVRDPASLATVATVDTGVADATALVAQDLGGDGSVDVGVTTSGGLLLTWTSTGSLGLLAGSAPRSVSLGGSPTGLVPVDLDHDGRTDLLTVDALAPGATVLVNRPVASIVTSSEEGPAMMLTLCAADAEGRVSGLRLSSVPPDVALYLDAALTQPVGAIVPVSHHVDGLSASAQLWARTAPDWNGTAEIRYVAVDTQGLASTEASISLQIAAVNDAPTPVPAAALVWGELGDGNELQMSLLPGLNSQHHDRYALSGWIAGEPVTLSTAWPQGTPGVSDVIDTTLAVLDHGGQLIASNDDRAVGELLSRLTLVPVAGEQYTVLIGSFADQGWQTATPYTYQLQVESAQPGVTLDPTAAALSTVLRIGPEDQPLLISAADLLAGWRDIDRQALGLGALVADYGVVSDLGQGQFRIDPTPDYNGPLHLSYSVGDGAVSTPAGLDLTLTPVNDAPMLHPDLLPAVGWVVGSGVAVALPAGLWTDVDTSALSYSLRDASGAALPPWLSCDPLTGLISGQTPVGTPDTTLQIIASASDGAFTVDAPTLTLSVLTGLNAQPPLLLP
jgi:ELWxxDGT repeat protein